MFDLGVDFDLVDDVAVGELVEDVEEVGRVDAVHGGAEALAFGEHGDFDIALGGFVGEAVDHVDFGTDGPGGAGFGVVDGLDDAFGGAVEVGLLYDFVHAFGVDHDGDVGVFGAGLVDVFGAEEFVDGAMAFPEDD